MAPPRHRDLGFSRRQQYGLFAGYVAAVAGVIACLGLILVARFDPIAFQGIRGLFLDATAPVSGAFRGVARGAGEIGGGLGAYLDAADQNRALRAELRDARARIVAGEALAFENHRLRAALRLVEAGTRPIATARVVGSGLGGVRRTIVVAAGAADGVGAGQPVRSAEGLVGRVAEAGAHAARVALLVDAATSVPVVAARTGQPALVLGRGEGLLDVRSTQLGAPPLRRGDLLLTSGTGGVFPANVPVAVVTGGSGEVASARPLADAGRLDVVLILPQAPSPPPPAPLAGAPSARAVAGAQP